MDETMVDRCGRSVQALDLARPTTSEARMRVCTLALRAAVSVSLWLFALGAMAAEYPAPSEGDWVAREFRFHTGEVMPELRGHYTALGNPSGHAVLVLHRTAGYG